MFKNKSNEKTAKTKLSSEHMTIRPVKAVTWPVAIYARDGGIFHFAKKKCVCKSY